MRILDVGAHDGFLSAYIQREFPGAHIDAIELNEQAATACDARISGTCKVGAAEDAPDLLGPGSYDLVFCGELIEHVTDVGRLLEALEAMLAPDGRILLSTPDGTFGTGGNEHHLRTYRAVDLAEVLRRRGRLVDMETGADGIVCAAYEPRPRLQDVAIYTGAGWEPWHPADITQRGLGGSETAAVRLAEELSELGHVVTVYGEMRQSAVWRDVIFRRHESFDPLDDHDVVITSRVPEVADRPIRASVRMLWLHDVDVGDRLTPQRAEAFNYILGLSAWHCGHLRGRYSFAADKVVQIRNGIHLPFFQ